jgi:ABC-type branched-subunit amino acid transport system ATPase component
VLTAIFNPVGIAGKFRTRRRATSRPEPADVAAPDVPNVARIAPPASAPVALRADEISVTYGGVRAVDSLSLTVRRGEIVGLIGPNGAGKTSFIDALTGFAAHTGSVAVDGVVPQRLAPHTRTRAGLRRTWQSLELFGDLTVRENVAVAGDRPSMRSVMRDLVAPGGAAREDRAVDVALARMGLAAVADELPATLPLGVQKLVGVARACAGEPTVLLLDEPAAGLDSDESRVLGVRLQELAATGAALLLVDHDMGLVLGTCDRVYVIDFGRLIFEGTPEEILGDPAVVAAYLGSVAVA